MRFTEEDIESKALQLAQAGVNQKDIETWIDTARKERESLKKENASIIPSNFTDIGKISGNISNQLESLANVGKMGAKMAVDEGPEMAARGAAGSPTTSLPSDTSTLLRSRLPRRRRGSGRRQGEAGERR